MPDTIEQIIAAERKALMNLMDTGDYSLPKRMVDENIIIATWNIQKFGAKKEKRTIQYIADIIERFDIIALQEVQTDLSGISNLLDLLPGNYRFLVSDATGNNERFVIIYDKRTVINTGYVSNIVFPVSSKTHTGFQLHRIPYSASFKAGRFDFILVTAHIFFGSVKEDLTKRETEIKELVGYIDKLSKRAGTKTFDHDFFVVGDFNIVENKDSFFNALVSKGFVMPPGMDDLKTNFEQNHTFDKIAWVDRKSFTFSGKFNIIPYFNAVYQDIPKKERKKMISDHLPLWAEFKVNKLTQELDAAIKNK